MKKSKAIKFRKAIRRLIEPLQDTDAVTVKDLYEPWRAETDYHVGDRCIYTDRLYKVKTEHTSHTQYPPSINTASLYEEIPEAGQGTKTDPILYNNNMELVKDMYYWQSDITYLCTRSTGVAVYNNLSDLVGLYVEVAE